MSKEVWKTSWNGHELSVVNGAKAQFLCDGNIIAEQKGIIQVRFNLIGSVDGKTLIAILDGGFHNQTKGTSISVRFFVCDELDCEYGIIDKNGEYSVIPKDE